MKIGFISDIHEDIHSLEKALVLLEANKCECVYCLGDIVGFSIPFYRYIETRNAEECIRLVKENCSAVVAGNHDLYAVRKTPYYEAGFNYGTDWYQLDYDLRAKKARNKIWLYEDNEITCRLSETSHEFLMNLPEIQVVELNNKKYFLSHFCFPDFTGSAIHFPGEAFHLKKHFEFMNRHECSVSVSGHGHPGGVILVDEDIFSSLKFGSYNLKEGNIWIVIPCVARTTRENGIMIIDTSEETFEVISMK